MEKWSGRLIPMASSAIGAGLNYYFVRAWGERARKHFREKHLEIRHRRIVAEHHFAFACQFIAIVKLAEQFLQFDSSGRSSRRGISQ